MTTPSIFELGASPLKSLRNWKIDFLFQTSDQKTDFRSLIFSEIHAFKIFFFLSLENSANFFFFVWDGYVQRDFTICEFRRCLEEDYVFCRIMRD